MVDLHKVDGLVQPLKIQGKKVFVLTQDAATPDQFGWFELRTLDDYLTAIKTLMVRGAPTIGVVAAYGLARLHAAEPSRENLEKISTALFQSRPTAVNLAHALTYVGDAIERDYDRGGSQVAIQASASGMAAATDYHLAEEARTKSMVSIGAAILYDHSSFLTICDTGPLAAPGYGTALGCVLELAKVKPVDVYACETRPLRQGARLTMFEAWAADRDVTPHLLVDSAAAMLMAQRKVTCVLAGADRIAQNGDTANKIGTYSLAVLADHFKIPFYIVAPVSTIDMSTPYGAAIPIEYRSPDEVTDAWGRAGLDVLNPAFDVTPRELIWGYITDQGYSDRNTTLDLSDLVDRR